MVKEIDRGDKFDKNVEKVLVCITAQSNSKRLISEGAKIADIADAELHILHVLKGNSVFNNNETPILLQQLFQYGSEKGGMVHAYCDENIPESIAEFIKKEKITRLVLGEPPTVKKLTKKQVENQFHKILSDIPKSISVVIVGREDYIEHVSEEVERRKIV